jgi:glycosyltransferase involved in cell wall biosynthesis/tetratricopeptide (TPR) repeat protein
VNFDKTALFVLGMHRSGTSALTRRLNLLGARLPTDLLPPGKGNSLGHWEPRKVMQLNDRLLALLDRPWDDPKPMPVGWRKGRGAISAVEEARELIRNEYGGRGGFVLKDPRLCRLMPLWRDALSSFDIEAACFIAVRNPLDVFKSLEARDGLDALQSFALWLSHVLEAELATRGLPRALVSYDTLLNDWRAALSRALEGVGIEGLTPPDKGSAVDDFLDPSQRHHSADLDQLLTHPEAGAEIKEAYRALLSGSALDDPTIFDTLRRRWQGAWVVTNPGPAASAFTRYRPEVHLQRSKVLADHGDLDEAIAAAHRAAELKPGRPHLHHHLATLLLKADKLEEAEAEALRAIALDEAGAWFHRTLSVVQHRLGRYGEAVAAAHRAAELKPGRPHLHHHLANMLADAGQLDEAAGAVRRAVIACVDTPGFDQSLDAVGDRLSGMARADDTPVSTTAALNNVSLSLAWSGGNYWAKSLEHLIQGGFHNGCDELPWPLGNAAPTGMAVPIAPRCEEGPGVTLSVMMPVYNPARGEYSRGALESVLAQDKGPDWAEIVVVDDASSTSTARLIAAEFAPRVTYRRSPENLGLVGNHNLCLESARGKFIHILHQDDRIEPGFYEALLGPLSANRGLAAAFVNCRFMDTEGAHTSHMPSERAQTGELKGLHQRLAIQQRIMFPSIIVRRAAYEAHGGFSPSLIYSFDWEMWGRLAAAGRLWYEPRALALYRLHPASATSRLDVFERLIDEFRAAASILRGLPAPKRQTAAAIALSRILLKYWHLLTTGTAMAGTSDGSPLIEFLRCEVSRIRELTDDFNRPAR